MKKEAEIAVFEKIQAQLHGLYDEMTVFSKKKPDDPVNKFKLKVINQIITNANTSLDDENRPFNDFESFDEDTLPTNSDVVMILSQYINCLEKFRSENITLWGGGWYWEIYNKRTEIRTSAPKKLSY